MKRPLFLDRDGVLNRDIAPYVRHRSELEIFEFTGPALSMLSKHGYEFYVISNQQGVALGLTQSEELEACSDLLQSHLEQFGTRIERFYYCTYRDAENHPWRKPSPGMILSAGEEFAFEPQGAFVIGDKWTDMEAAARAGCRGLLVLTGVTPNDGSWKSWKFPPERVFNNLLEAAEWIVANN